MLSDLGETAQGPLAKAAELPQPAASKHLALLARACFVHVDRTGGRVGYRIVRANLMRFRMALARL